MKERKITQWDISRFGEKMAEEEKCKATKDNYLRDIRAFASFCGDADLKKETVIAYKQKLLGDGYAVRSVNSMVTSVNRFFSFLGWHDARQLPGMVLHRG